jgi:hypothetical protein
MLTVVKRKKSEKVKNWSKVEIKNKRLTQSKIGWVGLKPDLSDCKVQSKNMSCETEILYAEVDFDRFPTQSFKLGLSNQTSLHSFFKGRKYLLLH